MAADVAAGLRGGGWRRGRRGAGVQGDAQPVEMRQAGGQGGSALNRWCNLSDVAAALGGGQDGGRSGVQERLATQQAYLPGVEPISEVGQRRVAVIEGQARCR